MRVSPTLSTVFMTLAVLALGLSTGASAQFAHVNFESAHVHPLDLLGNTLVAVNTSGNSLEIFDVSGGTPVQIGSVPVGYDPVSARFRTSTEVWVVNHLSDTVSVVDLSTMNVKATIQTKDEPCDVVFPAGEVRGLAGAVAYVSCSQANVVQRFNVTSPYASAGSDFDIPGEDPRALALSVDGTKVYVAIFESGNSSTILNGGLGNGGFDASDLLPNVVADLDGPHGGMNPPPNNGGIFEPPVSAQGIGPRVSLIVQKDSEGAWLDDTGANWTSWITGAKATRSGRVTGWDMLDNDIVEINAQSGAIIGAATRIMNINMAMTVNPNNGDLIVVGTDATNLTRFEPNITGTFTRVKLGIVDETNMTVSVNIDMNEAHLDAAQAADPGGGTTAYSDASVPQADRDKSIGDPRGIAVNATNSILYVTGMGSNNVVRLNPATGVRLVLGETIEVEEGPTGIVYHQRFVRSAPADRIYILNRFTGSISVIAEGSSVAFAHIPFFDPTPEAIKVGRKHFYGTHETSGLGQLACASCHVDGHMDQLAWDLGNPAQAVRDSDNLENKGFGTLFGGEAFEDPHPMKGPMTTQTFQDIIGKEPFHWRGDRRGLESFNGAFVGLQGADLLTTDEMAEFKAFLSTIHFPPNPFRNLDNSLPTSMDLGHQFASGRFVLARGAALPSGNAARGLQMYIGEVAGVGAPDAALDGPLNCIDCHSLPNGNGPDAAWNAGTQTWDPIPPDADGNHHIGMVSNDGLSNKNIKVPQLRNAYDKLGMDLAHPASDPVGPSRKGFGFLHDGAVDSISSFLAADVFNFISDQDHADVIAFCMAIGGSGFDSIGTFLSPASINNGVTLLIDSNQTSQDAHAAVGWQTTFTTSGASTAEVNARIVDANGAGAARGATLLFDIIAKGNDGFAPRGWTYQSGVGNSSVWRSDKAAETNTLAQIRAFAGSGTEVTFTVVPVGLGERLGLDRDDDGDFDRDEVLAGTDPSFREVWVQFAFGGLEEGVFDQPFNSLAEAETAIAEGTNGDTVRLKAGSTTETGTFSTAMILLAPDGAATLGAP